MKVVEVRDSVTLIEDVNEPVIIESDNSHVHQVEVPIQTGPPGLDAYQLALNNGFVGTHEEWQRSLSAYGIALSNGFVGSEEEWLEYLREGLTVYPEDSGKILTNDGEDQFWMSLEDRLNNDTITWDLGDI